MRCFIAGMLFLFSFQAIADTRFYIDWLSRLPSHGINVAQKDWVILVREPSPETVERLVQKYARYMDTGQVDRKLFQPGWRIADTPRLSENTPELTKELLTNLEPAHPEYQILMKALEELRGWRESAPDDFPDDLILFKGDTHAAIPKLNRWLRALDLADSLPSDIYTQAHKDVLTEVQLQFKLMPDGRLGALTRQALIAITNQHIRTLKTNLERLRWLPRQLPYPHMKVDIAGYNVVWAEAKEKNFYHKAIVGMPHKQTPVFSHAVDSVTFNPIWKVPQSIASSSMLRNIKADPEFLEREGFLVYQSWNDNAPQLNPDNINWQQLRARNFLYRLEQLPGVDNRLGKYKLGLPNEFGVYLHDTNKPELFDKDARSLSSGCTRVHNIDVLINRMGQYLGMTAEFDSGHHSEVTTKIELAEQIPIYFVYFTAWPDAEGRVRFRKDIYQLDNALNSWF
ncbi:L,D-transpeptidase family protein [Endozoicomonadaceae bacterium StTr2]